MTRRKTLFVTFVLGLAFGLVLARGGLPGPWPPETGREEGPPPPVGYGAVPADRVSLLVMKWVLENDPAPRAVRFVAWEPPATADDNPFTHAACTRVRVVLARGAAGADHPRSEPFVYYVADERVLGGVPDDGPALRPVGGQRVGSA